MLQAAATLQLARDVAAYYEKLGAHEAARLTKLSDLVHTVGR